MSAPAGDHEADARRLDLVINREYEPDPDRCVAAAIKLLTYRPPGPVDDDAPSEHGARSGAR